MAYERNVEEYLTRSIRELGGLCEKFVSPQKIGIPDRLITYKGRMHVVELKRPDEFPRESQVRDHLRRLRCGIKVHIIDNREKVDFFIEYLQSLE